MSGPSGERQVSRRIDIKTTLYLIVICLVMQSCASDVLERSTLSCDGDEWLPVDFRAPAVTAVGRVKIDLPKYRVRGICRIDFNGDDDLTIDFKHSSLFGAYEEDVLVRLRDGELTLVDRERGRWFDADSSLAIITSGVGFEFYADDLLYVLLFAFPKCSEMTGPKLSEGENGWRLVGEWRGRRIELEGNHGHTVESFSFCLQDEMDCFTTSYKYDDSSFYPNRITMSRDSGREKITFDIVDRWSGPAGSE